ncbi:MAG: LytTR family DNA-binding domain-containing protein [Pseudomonadota bacterium]
MTPILRILIVDDEAPARDRLARLLAQCENVELIGQCESPSELLARCRELQPNLLLLDVEMPQTDGLSLAREVGELHAPPAIVFVTAFEQYAVEAFDVRAADYLVKPVRLERLEAALNRVRDRLQRQPGVEEQPVLIARLAERITRIPLDEIRALIAEDKYVSVHYVGGVALVEESLVQLEQRFGEHFLRIHRNALVARSHLRSLFRDPNGSERVEIDDIEVRPEVSRRNLPVVRRALKGQAG